MVDVASFEQAGDDRRSCNAASRTGKPQQIAATVHPAEEGLSVYERLCQNAVYAPPQNPDWSRAWASQVNSDTVFALLRDQDEPVFGLPLEIAQVGFLRIARFPGGSHANGNFSPALPEFLQRAGAQEPRILVDAIRRARPDVDVVLLERQLETLDGYDNPLLALSKAPSPNVALAVDLEGGFDALLARASGKRKRKKVRSQTRKFEAAGGFRIIQAASPAEVERLLTAFFEMKAQQFEQMGVADVFASAEIQLFFRDLFERASRQSNPKYLLHGLEVGGRIRAVTGSSLNRNSIVCDFAAFAQDDLAQASPGEFLFFNNIKSACEAGLKFYDFSVGDERYKRLWCPDESRQYETVVPLTAKGRVFGTGIGALSGMKRFAKSSPRVRAIVKELRSRIG